MLPTTAEHLQAQALWLQLHDSAFPAGRLVHSFGLEEWLRSRPQAGPEETGRVVLGYVRHSVAPLDATITAAAWRPGAGLFELDRLAASFKLFDNARTASTSVGGQLAAAALACGLVASTPYLEAVIGGDTPGHGAVVDGAVQALLGVPCRIAVLGSLRSAMACMLSAAVRLGRLGPTHSQRIQADAAGEVCSLALQACERDLDDLHSTAPALEISGMRHEIRTARLFAT